MRAETRTAIPRTLAAQGTLALKAFSCLTFWLGLYSSPVSAQEFLNPGTGTLPGYEAPGMTSDDILIRQAVSVGLASDSNILESHTHAIQDTIFFVSPSVDIMKDSGRSIQEVIASATSAKYAISGNDSFTNVYVDARDTYFLSPSDQITANASVFDGVQRRILTNFDIPTNAAAPIPELILLGSVGYQHAWQNIATGASVTASQESFSDVRSTSGTILNQTYRNENDLLLNSFFNVQLSSRIKSSLTFQATDVEYQEQTRSFTQWRVAETITADLTSKTSIGVLAGLQKYNLYNVPDATQLGILPEYQVFLAWRPTQLLSFEARGGYKELGISYVLGYMGGTDSDFAFNATYLIWRDLQLKSGVEYERRFLTGNTEDILNYKAALNYQISRNASITLLYELQRWNSNIPIDSFNENIFQSSLNIRF
jgi:hypothetical protein